jgi:hypothetical protein
LVERQRNDKQTGHSMQVVLGWSAATILGLYPMDEGTKRTLKEVQSENPNTPSLNSMLF